MAVGVEVEAKEEEEEEEEEEEARDDKVGEENSGMIFEDGRCGSPDVIAAFDSTAVLVLFRAANAAAAADAAPFAISASRT